MTSGDLNIDLTEKNEWRSFGMTFDGLSNVFHSFLLRRLGAELDGGGVQMLPPPPPPPPGPKLMLPG